MKRSFKQNRVTTTGIDDQWNADLMDMTKFAKFNHGSSFVLEVIDIFSKYGWMKSLKDKKGEYVAKALKDILNKVRSPNRIKTDKGQEFRVKQVETFSL